MVDGWMVLDASNRIVDLNKTAEDILGSDRNQAIGKSIETYHIALPHLMSSSYAPREIEMKRTIKTINEVKFFNIRLSPIWSDQREPLTLVIWRDITNRRLLEEQRQKARDEMFVLLNAISSEASQSFSMEEFLSGVIYQIIFPFKSQAALIFLAEEYQNTAEDLTYRPASAFGLPEDSLSPITPPSAAYHLLEQVFSGEALVLEKPVDDLRLPSALRNEAFHTVLALPLILITGGNVKKMGVIFLARKNPEPFHQDEIVRLKTLADHIANLADSERRRKLAIAFSERQRLMRDLHDSVSQKLYGLVTLTEAAQAAVEAGSQMDPVQVFSRIGENARQAVKEMRLFLYQMQPVEVEKEGLISVLHHRLAAVEGRADIKAGLLADETIKLPSDKELALFYIAQEALNNILRHAHAKKVTVTYKQTRTNIILRIMDDGVGFNIKEVDHSGLGMANMKDRAEKINGKFKIISKVGRGTIVSVSLPKTRGK
jgi:PAS domain S-box-containing protein